MDSQSLQNSQIPSNFVNQNVQTNPVSNSFNDNRNFVFLSNTNNSAGTNISQCTDKFILLNSSNSEYSSESNFINIQGINNDSVQSTPQFNEAYIKLVLGHMSNCSQGKNCSTPHLEPSSQIISHGENCSNPRCPVCELLKQNHSGPMNNNSISQPPPETVMETNDWRINVSEDQRNHLIQRIVQTIFPSRDPSAFKDPRLSNLIEYAKRSENEIYNVAKDREEYFHLLSEKCFKIHKELEQKRKDRLVAIGKLTNGSQMEVAGVSSMHPCIESGCNSEEFQKKQESSHNSEVQDRFEHKLDNFSAQSSIAVKREQVVSECEVKPAEIEVKSESFEHSSNETSNTEIVKREPEISTIKLWTSEDLKHNFLPMWSELYNEKNAEWCREKVNYVALQIPDYPNVIKHPMDMTTIRLKLEEGSYKDPWEVVDDFWLMFKNAWLYNKKTSRVYKACSKLAEVFVSKINNLMKKLGFCCGMHYSYEPQVLFCNSVHACTIPKDAIYYEYENNSKSQILAGEKYLICEKCYNEADMTIKLSDDPQQDSEIVDKEMFNRLRNNVKVEEKFVNCTRCRRKWHCVCALYMEEIWSTGYQCPSCLQKTD